MSRVDRLRTLIAVLQDGALHRAGDLAAQMNVSERTIYRDMATLAASGFPVAGTPGAGYRTQDQGTRLTLSLSRAELEALHLGIAVVEGAADAGLSAAALALGSKLDAALDTVAAPESWDLATYPFADAARGLAHMAPLRAAISGRQKLRLSVAGTGTLTVRPLALSHWGRVWTLTVWCETTHTFRDVRIDVIETVSALPELFLDEPGKRLSDRPTNPTAQVRPDPVPDASA